MKEETKHAKSYWGGHKKSINALIDFWAEAPLRVKKNIMLNMYLGDMPVLESKQGHQLIIQNGLDLWDASLAGEPRFEKPDATKDEAYKWLSPVINKGVH